MVVGRALLMGDVRSELAVMVSETFRSPACEQVRAVIFGRSSDTSSDTMIPVRQEIISHIPRGPWWPT